MTPPTVAVLGGDEREHHIATRLAQRGGIVRTFAGVRDEPEVEYERARTLTRAVEGASWIICPYPGLGTNDEIYAPAAAAPVRIDRELLKHSRAATGGLVLGRATPAVRAVCENLGIEIHETKADSGLAVQVASAVSEALLALLVESTDRLLREHLYLVIGFGSTGFAISQLLLALRCEVVVAARSKPDRERARQLGARPIQFADRIAFMESAEIVINTVPDRQAVPLEVGASRSTARIFDIASPPGGMDHQAILGLGLDANWVRALGGLSAPASMAQAQLSLIEGLITVTSTPPEPPSSDANADPQEVRSARRGESTW